MGDISRNWAVITLHKWLPGKADQLAAAEAWGLDVTSFGRNDTTCYVLDDVRRVKRTTNWPAKLPERMAFITRRQADKEDGAPDGDGVFFATPLAVGFSDKLAKLTVEGLWQGGCTVHVGSIDADLKPGSDLAPFLDLVAKEANLAHVRTHRAGRV